MTGYHIAGLPLELVARYRAMDDAALAAQGARRVVATARPGYPCRITLEDADPGETLILLNYEDHRVDTPYRNRYAIYLREQATASARLDGTLPPVLIGRPIALRGYDADGNLKGAALAIAGDVEAKIGTLFADPQIAYLHAHNAAHGCFAARIDRA